MTVAPARPASTVVLVRPSHQRFDVFLVRRHDKIAFMGGAHVFPGGRVEEADRIENARALCDGVDQALARIPDVAPEEAIGYHAAAIRELFEEAGVLLARTANGEMVSLESDRFRGYRRRLAAGELSLREVAERERLRLALDQLVLFAHWVTPEVETKRFDTRFFMAAVPEGQNPVHDESETTDSAWLDPEDAIEQCRRDEIALPPPTWTTLRTLARYSSVDELLGWARRTRIVRVQPGFIKREDQTLLTLPGDPLHPPLAGFETPEETRFILENGRWRARR